MLLTGRGLIRHGRPPSAELGYGNEAKASRESLLIVLERGLIRVFADNAVAAMEVGLMRGCEKRVQNQSQRHRRTASIGIRLRQPGGQPEKVRCYGCGELNLKIR
jgi:hypothetical protein